MLEGLDRIDWSELSHSYGPATDTPGHLRNLASPDQAAREAAYDHLYGAVNHQGDIKSATAAVVPFLLELLASEETLQRDRLLHVLTALVQACDEHLYYVVDYNRIDATIPFGFYRWEMDTYRNLCAGVDLYLSLLKHPDGAIRMRAAALIGLLPDQGQRAHDAFWEAIAAESDDSVLADMLHSFPAVVPNRWDQEAGEWKRYLAPLEALAQTHPPPRVRLRAAMALVELTHPTMSYRPHYAPRFIVEMLVDALADPERYDLGIIGYEASLLRGLRRMGHEVMATALTMPGMNARLAHLIGREMLERVFERRGACRWDTGYADWHRYEVLESGIPFHQFKGMYRLPEHHRAYEPGGRLTPDQRFVLQQIVACDVFWEQPTNLFSFFYGLPDDRESLRLLAE